ncbi:MAG: phosphate transport system permease protein [Pseudomonadota bacterium]|nr:phosphate transport system permease protein [Pseudomonadota bacterium]
MKNSIRKDNSWHQRKRALIDNGARYAIGLGGMGIIFAVVLIFFYLLWVVLPIFKPVEVQQQTRFELPAGEAVNRYLVMEEGGELAARILSTGEIQFINLSDGQVINQEFIDLPEYGSVLDVVELDREGRQLALVLDNTRLLFIGLNYRVNFHEGKRELITSVDFPYGEEPLELRYIDRITRLAAQHAGDKLLLAALDADGELLLQSYDVEEADELGEPIAETLLNTAGHVDFLLFDTNAEWMYLANRSGEVIHYRVSDLDEIELMSRMRLLPPERQLTHLTMLLGGVSMLAADDQGKITQWSLQRDDKNQYALREVRSFQSGSALVSLLPEHRRKGMTAINEKGELLVFYTTSERKLFEEKMITGAVNRAVLSSRADRLLVETSQGYQLLHIENDYPELSWQALWGKVMYEGYTEPQYLWQSSAANNDFEPKFSLAPLAYGTLKAAFYAMIVAVPLAIMGAIYTAYFMSPKMRGWVKPSIEIMGALPTAILGFLAGLWFAPYVEENLLAVLSLTFIFPVGLMLFAWCWTYLPVSVRHHIPEGWHAAVLIPVIILIGWATLLISPYVEMLVFGGNIRGWMLHEFGIGYDQRNALVVGIAMGLAVIPSIFSISEDAIFSVPKHLINGSLALGATTWQTLTRVVLLTASPGIFSAVMIGLGRAVGETMIVLMATGNTPVMDESLFQGMRTLSANIAVELPESELNSTHYRILFLAALVLFIVTFIFNTAAEVIRQRLRKRYGSL